MIVLILVAGGLSQSALPTEQSELIPTIIRCGLLTILVAVLLSRWGWWRRVGFKPPKTKRDLLYFAIPLVIPLVLNLVPSAALGNPPNLLEVIADAFSRPTYVLIDLAVSLLISFTQEGIFRGVMLQAILPRGTWKAVIITALLFGLIHLLGLLFQGAEATALQVSYLLATGFLFAALVVKKGLIWPLIIIHFLWDFTGIPHPNGMDTTASIPADIGMITVFLVYGVFVMMSGDGSVRARTRAVDAI